MIELEFIDSVNDSVFQEFTGNMPSVGERVVFGPPYNDDEDTQQKTYVVIETKRYYYSHKGELYEVGQVILSHCE